MVDTAKGSTRLPENHTPAPSTHNSDHADDLHGTVVCAVDAIRATVSGIRFDSPANGAARALHFIADGLSDAASKYERIELDAMKSAAPTSINDIPPFGPALTEDEFKNGIKAAEAWGITRRLAYASLTKSQTEILKSLDEGGEQSADLLIELAEKISELLEWREAETKLYEAAQARLLLVLSISEGIE